MVHLMCLLLEINFRSETMDKSEERTQQRILDLANMADRRGIITSTDFMNLNELNIFPNKV